MDRDAVLRLLRERILAFVASRFMRDAAEDLTQEVLLVLEEKYRHVTEMTDLVPLALRITRFKMMTVSRTAYRRGEHSTVSVDDISLFDEKLDQEAELEQRQMRERLARAIAQGSGTCRDIFRWKLQGLSFGEIQQRLGAPSINTVYTLDHRCRQKLRETLGGSWCGPPKSRVQ